MELTHVIIARHALSINTPETVVRYTFLTLRCREPDARHVEGYHWNLTVRYRGSYAVRLRLEISTWAI